MLGVVWGAVGRGPAGHIVTEAGDQLLISSKADGKMSTVATWGSILPEHPYLSTICYIYIAIFLRCSRSQVWVPSEPVSQ